MFLMNPVSTAWPSPMIMSLFDRSVSIVSRVSGCVVVGYGSNDTMFGLMKMVFAFFSCCLYIWMILVTNSFRSDMSET